jgi:hypothetical protein
MRCCAAQCLHCIVAPGGQWTRAATTTNGNGAKAEQDAGRWRRGHVGFLIPDLGRIKYSRALLIPDSTVLV